MRPAPGRPTNDQRKGNNPMSDNDDGPDMDLASGIAAFESREFGRAAGLLGPLADAGEPEARYRLAIMAQNGLGMVQNRPLAFEYMRSAAEAGMGLAQHGLGFMYLEGECVDKDPAKAVEWFERAAAQGLQGSMTTLGMMYREGNGVARDEAKARAWLERAGFDDA
jgi:TPR repeat protein